MSKLVRFDWAIKYLLRNKANFDILEGFLSELLKTPIKIERVLESEGNKNHAEDKFNRVDLFVHTAENKHIIIEVQCSSEWDYLSRILYGASKAICENLREGEAYSNLCKVISVSIVFFNLGHGKDYLYHGSTNFKGIHFNDTLDLNAHERKLYEQPHTSERATPETLFPEYYIIKVTAFKERVKDKFDEWVYFLKHGKIEKDFAAQGIQSAAKKLDVLQLTEEQRRAYEYYQEGLHDEGSIKEMLNITKAEGVEEGIEIGIEIGIEKERAEGHQQMLQVARSLKQAGLSDEAIAAHTQLSLEDIKNS